MKNVKGMLPEGSCGFLSLNRANIILLCMKRCEDNEAIMVRLQEIQGKDTDLELTLSPLFRIRKCYLTDIVERKIRQLSSKNNCVKLRIEKFEIVTLRVEKETYLRK